MSMNAALGRSVTIAAIVVLFICLATNIHAAAVPIAIVLACSALSTRLNWDRAAFERGMAVVFAYYDDVHFIGPALDLYRSEADIETRLALILTTLFARLEETDAGILNANQRKFIYRELDRSCYYIHFAPQMIVAAIRALAQVGDRTTVPVLKRLIRSAWWRRTVLAHATA